MFCFAGTIAASRCQHITVGRRTTVVTNEIHGVLSGSGVVRVLVLSAGVTADVLPDLAVPVVVHDPGERELEVTDRGGPLVCLG